MASKELFLLLSKRGLSEKNARAVKEEFGIKAYRRNHRWFWSMKKARDHGSSLIYFSLTGC